MSRRGRAEWDRSGPTPPSPGSAARRRLLPDLLAGVLRLALHVRGGGLGLVLHRSGRVLWRSTSPTAPPAAPARAGCPSSRSRASVSGCLIGSACSAACSLTLMATSCSFWRRQQRRDQPADAESDQPGRERVALGAAARAAVRRRGRGVGDARRGRAGRALDGAGRGAALTPTGEAAATCRPWTEDAVSDVVPITFSFRPPTASFALSTRRPTTRFGDTFSVRASTSVPSSRRVSSISRLNCSDSWPTGRPPSASRRSARAWG